MSASGLFTEHGEELLTGMGVTPPKITALPGSLTPV